jgi:hypothetical protein
MQYFYDMSTLVVISNINFTRAGAYHNLQCTSKFGGKMTLRLRKKPGQPKVCYFGLEIIIQKNIAGFNISMNDAQMEILV